MTTEPFAIDIPQHVLDELHERLGRTRYTKPSSPQPWEAGVDPGYLRELVHFWAHELDWRHEERRLNGYSHHRADIRGRHLHYVTIPAVDAPEGVRHVPLLLIHGWPSSFIEMLPLAERLADPKRHGGTPELAFDLVIPSLPGFLFSEAPATPLTREAMADDLHTLMTQTLGHESYGAFGGDIGGAVAGWLGAKYPDEVLGIHMIHPPYPANFDEPLSADEQAFLAAEAAYDESDGGYSAIMMTRPDTVAAALVDSPAGLLAWIIDKYRDWSDSSGDLESRFNRETMAVVATLYWTTESMGSSFRQYFDWDHGAPRPTIDVPTAFTLSHEPSMQGFPRSIAERACSDIRLWNEPDRGGHFMAQEEPELLARDICEFFASLDPRAG